MAYVDVDEDPSTGAWVGPTWYPNETQVSLYPTHGSMAINPPDGPGLIRFSFIAADCNEPGWETRPGKFVMRFVDVMADGYVWNDPTTWQQRNVMNAKFKLSHGDITNYHIYNGPDDPANILNPDPTIEVIAYESWDMVDEVDRATGSGDHSLYGVNAGFSELVFLTDFADSEVHYIELSLIPKPEPVKPSTDGLVAQYAFENDTADSSGNGLHGTIVGNPSFVEGPAGYGMALDFDGVDDLVELGKFDVFGQITLAGWIRPDTFAINDARIISKANEWGGNDHWWMLSTISETSLRFRLKTDDGQDTATLISDPVLEADVWTHVAAAWDGSTMRIYSDGVEVASQEKGGSAVAVDPNVSVAIASQPSDAFASDPSRVAKFFDGLIDEVGIYHAALSPGEIRFLAGYLPKPVDPGTENLAAFYTLDNDANDTSGNNNNGTPSGDPQWVVGKIGGALEFDGVDDQVDCGNDPSLDITGTITIAAWFYPTGSGSSSFPRIVDKSNGTGGADPGYKLYLRGAEDYIFAFSAGGVYQPYSTLAAELNAWNYVAVIADGTHRKLYLNGAWEEWEESTLPSSSSNPLFIGNSPAGARHFQGMIDEVAIYNRALSGPEVRFIAGER
jgi:hypothetical protein